MANSVTPGDWFEPDQSDLEVADPTGEFPFNLPTYALHLAIVVDRQRELKIERLLRPVGSSSVRHRALSVIGRLKTCTMSDLADFSSADRTTLTRTVDQLVELGLAMRTTPPTDRRQVLLSLTPLGVTTHQRSMRLVREFNHQAVAGIEEDDLRTAMRVFERIAANIIDDPDRAPQLLLRQNRGE